MIWNVLKTKQTFKFPICEKRWPQPGSVQGYRVISILSNKILENRNTNIGLISTMCSSMYLEVCFLKEALITPLKFAFVALLDFLALLFLFNTAIVVYQFINTNIVCWGSPAERHHLLPTWGVTGSIWELSPVRKPWHLW